MTAASLRGARHLCENKWSSTNLWPNAFANTSRSLRAAFVDHPSTACIVAHTAAVAAVAAAPEICATPSAAATAVSPPATAAEEAMLRKGSATTPSTLVVVLYMKAKFESGRGHGMRVKFERIDCRASTLLMSCVEIMRAHAQTAVQIMVGASSCIREGGYGGISGSVQPRPANI